MGAWRCHVRAAFPPRRFRRQGLNQRYLDGVAAHVCRAFDPAHGRYPGAYPAVLLQRGDLGADVLVLPHHGGVERSSKAFLEAVAPSAVIRSSHERMEETYNGLQEVVGAMPLHNTADVGAVGVVIDAEGVRVSSMVVVALLLPVDVLVVELDPPGQYLFQQFSWR